MGWMENKQIIPPEGGWESRTWYRGRCKMRPSNPEFGVIIYSGFVDEKTNEPKGYSGFFPDNYAPDEITDISFPFYLKVTEKLFTVDRY